MIHVGDCVEVMRGMDASSIDAICTDPPYHLSFMGSTWDHAPTGAESQAEHHRWAVEALRVLKPGGHLVAFGGTRTYHRLASALEDAGFEIRDCLSYMYGSGFPKSLNVSKAIDAAAGATREPDVMADSEPVTTNTAYGPGLGIDIVQRGAPATPEAREWEGWGTALKPSWEPVVLARKPLAGTVAGNVVEHGTGALNIDATRIGFAGAGDEAEAKAKNQHGDFGTGRRVNHVFATDGGMTSNYDAPGRWPANTLLSHDPDCVQLDPARVNRNGHHPAARGEGGLGTAGHAGQADLDERSARGELAERWACVPGCPVRMLDDQSGYTRDGVAGSPRGFQQGGYVGGQSPVNPALPSMVGYGAGGYASRFYYCAKASRAERNAGLDDLPLRDRGTVIGQLHQGVSAAGNVTGQYQPRRNHHPTVKPVAVMRWLCRLICPPGGTILDPFLGSGTTGIAAVLEGFRFVGCERDAEYAELARRRVAYWTLHGEEALDVVRRAERSERERVVVAESGQLDLFGGAV